VVSFVRIRLQMAVAFLTAASAAAAQPTTPLSDLGAGTYLGFTGGLYENGSNEVPADHLAIGLAHANAIEPLDAAGSPSLTGKVVLLSIGMSNTTQEFCSAQGTTPCASWSFVGQTLADAGVDHTVLTLVNGARGGKSASYWTSPTSPEYDRIRDVDLANAGATEAQVQAAWVKVANPGPTLSLPSAGADAYTLVAQMGSIARALRTRYPHLHIVYFSSRIYAGYATTTLNPEPYAYESALAVRWVIEAQIGQERGGAADARAGDLDPAGGAPWLSWAAYPWANGTAARSDGLVWLRSDLESDGTHPSTSGETKVGAMLLTFWKGDPTSRRWFRAWARGDVDGSGALDVNDVFFLIDRLFTGGPPTAGSGDVNGDGRLDVADVFYLINHLFAGGPPPV
jgi:hypothetical protein